MVDLGQKRWKKFRLFYFYFEKRENRVKNTTTKKRRTANKPSVFFLFSISLNRDYFSNANLLVTSVQLITLKKASI
jgi:hypothetical protein